MKALLLFITMLALTGCDSESEKTAEQIQAEVVASQKKFAEERQRIERENQAAEAKLAEQRSFVSVAFVSVNTQRIEVELSNNTGKPIDNLSGSLDIEDDSGEYVTGIALTNWVPGDIYLPVGATAIATKGLELERPRQRNRIVAEADGYRYHYTTHRIQYVGEEERSFLEITDPQQQKPEPATAVVTSRPVTPNKATPEACAENQLGIETEEQSYPGSQCSHISRNIESERFKQEYISLCQTQTRAEAAPASAARVQISSCMKAPGGQGIVYKKLICCDLP